MEKILIVDFGSQYTQLIARAVREVGVFSEIIPVLALQESTAEALKNQGVIGVVLSGGPSSVYEDKNEALGLQVKRLVGEVPILGICFGYQLLVSLLGGEVKEGLVREYGPANVKVDAPKGPFRTFLPGETLRVWMSHGDVIASLPEGFQPFAHSEFVPFAASGNPMLHAYGVQFHPEVWHTKEGSKILENFLLDICNASRDWQTERILELLSKDIQAKTKDRDILLALSGGVDSSVMGVLLKRMVGERLHSFLVDTGLLREGEPESTLKLLEPLGLNVHVVDAKEKFMEALKGISDPELKRKRIGGLFIDLLREEARNIGFPELLAQGTLYPDVIESMPVVGPSDTIKSHHNVGGLPKDMPFELLEPFRMLFKDEVRRIGEALGVPEEIVWKEPFPGPGLAVRILGPVDEASVKTVRKADAIVLEEVSRSGIGRSLWQAFAVLLPVKSVGVKGDKRSYENTVVLRAVESRDGMTAGVAKLPYELLERIAHRIVNEAEGVNRVAYDITSKPPATIEWE
jgi:GMP synthase (glutamine-hydrolysing)